MVRQGQALAWSVAATGSAAVVGNAFIGRDALDWFGALTRPRYQLPLPGFVLVGAVYYVQLGTVLYRALRAGDRAGVSWALVVLTGNELWNAALFGRRSPVAGFAGCLVFTIPVLNLQRALARDPVASLVLAPYTAWVLLYDVPWSYALWRLNPVTGVGRDPLLRRGRGGR